ncbi:MAG: AMP-binding protein [Lyngbya sp.]|nr:AMP-binding protein [Lyngbya sp.]
MATMKSNEFATLVDLLNYRSEHQPNHTAYIFLEEGETESCKLTYQQLDQQAKAIAVSLQSLAQPGERALMLYPPGIEFLPAFFGCLYAGIVPVPAYPPRSNHNLTRLESIISDAEVGLVLTTTSVLEKIKSQFAQNNQFTHIHYLATETVSSELASDWQKPTLDKDSLAFLQYTSGSTGNPKGVMVTHQNLLHNHQLMKMAMGHSEKTIFVVWLPLFHDMGLVGNVLQSLYLGVPSILMSPVAFLQKPIRWLQAISGYKATMSGGPNFAYDLCTQKIKPEQCDGIDLSSWTVAFNGAEPVRAETLEKFTKAFAPFGFRPQAFYPCYGMAETTLFISGGLQSLSPVFYEVNRTQLQQNLIERVKNQPVDSQTLVGCGQTFFDKIIIVDPESQIRCEANQVGEIWVAGDSVAKGYWNRPEQTEKTFKATLTDTKEGPFLRTGDLGFFQEGELFITGRLKDVIIIRGRNHYPQDIEQTVEKSHPALRANSGAAFAVEIDGTEQLVIAQEVERSFIRKLDVDEVVGAIRKAVSEEHELLVSGVILLKTASIPKTSSGKIQRHACKQGYLENTLNVVGSWTGMMEKTSSSTAKKPTAKQATPREIQQWIIYWLSQKLKLEPWAIDPSKALADYGLDSVTAVELADSLGNWLGQSLDMTLAWNFPTIEALANYLASLSNSNTKSATEPPEQTPENHCEQDSNQLIEVATTLSELSELEIAQLLAQEITMVQQSK